MKKVKIESLIRFINRGQKTLEDGGKILVRRKIVKSVLGGNNDYEIIRYLREGLSIIEREKIFGSWSFKAGYYKKVVAIDDGDRAIYIKLSYVKLR